MLNSLKSKIISYIMLSATVLVVATYTILYFINIEKSKEFNSNKVQIIMNTISVLDKKSQLKFLEKLSKEDPYIKYIKINNKIIKGISYSKKDLFEKNLGDIHIVYAYNATDIYVENLEVRMAAVAGSFYFLIFLMSIFIGKLLTPFEEIVSYFENFSENNFVLLNYRKKNIASEFKYVQKSINKMVLDLNEYQDKMKELAYIDTLTGLKNRRSYLKDIKKQTGDFSVLFLDLDGFKLINDTLGHEAGDSVLIEVGNRLSEIDFEIDFEIYRIGGDEFLIIFKTNDRTEVERFCQYIHKYISEDFFIKDQIINISTSIGISISDSEIDRNYMLESDIAMYESKQNGKNSHLTFNNKMLGKIENKLKLIRDIKVASINEEFDFVLQPQTDKKGKIIGAEALIRWNKDGKILSPFFFIDILENSKYMIPVGNKLIENVFEFSKKMKRKINISINLSEIQLEDISFIPNMVKLIDKTGINPHEFEFEITERWKSIDSRIVISNLNALKKLGFKLSIDDFGEDQSSFKRTDMLPIDKLKLDKSFTDRLFFEKSCSTNSIKAILKYARLEDIDMIAEGVETIEQKNKLIEIGINKFQGYYFYKPLSKEEFLIKI